MDGLEARDNLPWLLWQLFFSAKPELYGLAETRDLTILQMFGLCLLEPDSEIPMSSLWGMLHCDASNVTGIVDKLVSIDAVTRQESSKDRRIKIIQLTPRGLELRGEFLDKMRGLVVPDVNVLSPDERTTLVRLLNKLLE